VANTWKVDNYKMNGYDYTSLVTDYRETFSKDGNFSFNWGTSSGTGTWTFQNDDTEIRLTGVSNQSSHTMTILKLEEKSFWYYFTENNDRHEYHMIPQ
ncbi:MAG TPA: hypothetical protein VI731_07625, partial [Bacteroidia bacterium]|nr:hypothetical protein [Bacteroidia bacterium]